MKCFHQLMTIVIILLKSQNNTETAVCVNMGQIVVATILKKKKKGKSFFKTSSLNACQDLRNVLFVFMLISYGFKKKLCHYQQQFTFKHYKNIMWFINQVKR